MDDLMLLGIHGTNESACFCWIWIIWSSTSLVEILAPRKMHEAARYFPLKSLVSNKYKIENEEVIPSWVTSSHHVVDIEHLRSKLTHSEVGKVLLSKGSERGNSSDKEMETRERDQIDSHFTEIWVQLTRESEATGNARHNLGNELVQVSVGWIGNLLGSFADSIKGFVVKAAHSISWFYELMER